MKKLGVAVVKYGVSLGIVGWLLWDARGNQLFATLVQSRKDWGLLALAWLACFAAVAATFVRWFLLVRALGLSFSLRDAFRLGFLGYLFNFVSFGGVGGDLIKAIFVARQMPGRRAEAVATVAIDRLIGLYFLFILASGSLLLTGQLTSPAVQVRVIGQAALACTGLGAVALVLLLVPGVTNGRLSQALARLPRIGTTLHKLILAVRIYRTRAGVLTAAGILSLVVHACNSVGIYLAAHGILPEAPSLAAHLVAVPLAMVTGVLPLPVGGLGAFEGVLEFMYRHIPSGLAIVKGSGLLAAFAYRLITLAIAAVGMCYYLACRREVVSLVQAAEQEAEISGSLKPGVYQLAEPAEQATPGVAQPAALGRVLPGEAGAGGSSG